MSNISLETVRNEIKLLLAAVRIKSSSETKNRIEELLRGDLDWAFLIDTADRHRVFPLLYNNLFEKFRSSIPPDVYKHLRNRYHHNTIHNKLLARELVNIVKSLYELNIPCIPFKGPMSAVTIYGDISCREFGDLDILVDQNDYYRVQEYLVGAGYTKTNDWKYESEFQHKPRMISIDIHKTFDNYNLLPDFEFRELSKRLKPLCLSSCQINGLSAEDTLLTICINFAKDLFLNKTRLSQLSDIANLIDLHPSLDWPWLMEHAERYGLKRILFIGLAVSSTLLGVNLPEEIQRQINIRRKVNQMIPEITAEIMNLLSGQTQLCGNPKNLKGRQELYLKLKERMRDRLPMYCQVIKRWMLFYKVRAIIIRLKTYAPHFT